MFKCTVFYFHDELDNGSFFCFSQSSVCVSLYTPIDTFCAAANVIHVNIFCYILVF